MVPGEIAAEQPHLQISRVFGENLLAEMAGKMPPPFGHGAAHLTPERSEKHLLLVLRTTSSGYVP